jgi:hypothetical protein
MQARLATGLFHVIRSLRVGRFSKIEILSQLFVADLRCGADLRA